MLVFLVPTEDMNGHIPIMSPNLYLLLLQLFLLFALSRNSPPQAIPFHNLNYGF